MILRTPTWARTLAPIAAGLIYTLFAVDADAQTVLPQQAAGYTASRASAAQAARPRFEVAIGMGLSVDNPGLLDGRTVGVPSFQVQAGVGDGPIGLEVRLFSSAADGRYHQANGASEMAVNRLAVDLMLAWRPLSGARGEDDSLAGRMLRSLTAEGGLGIENATSSQKGGTRGGFVVGAHLDFPLTSTTDSSELRVRVAARRLLAGEAMVGSIRVSDSVGEAFAALVFVF